MAGANLHIKDLTELVHSVSVNIETAVRNIQPAFSNTKSKINDDDVRYVVNLAAKHVGHKKWQGVQTLDSVNLRNAIFTGPVNRAIAKDIYEHPIFARYANSMFVAEYIAGWDEEQAVEADYETNACPNAGAGRH